MCKGPEVGRGFGEHRKAKKEHLCAKVQEPEEQKWKTGWEQQGLGRPGSGAVKGVPLGTCTVDSSH